jgi:hypothetical protein
VGITNKKQNKDNHVATTHEKHRPKKITWQQQIKKPRQSKIIINLYKQRKHKQHGLHLNSAAPEG